MSIEPPPFSCLEELVSHFAQVAPDATAILAPGREALSYGGLRARVPAIIGGLRRLGVPSVDC